MKTILLALSLGLSLPVFSADPAPAEQTQCIRLAQVFKSYNDKVQKARIKTTDSSGAILADGSCAEGLMAEKMLKDEKDPKTTKDELASFTCKTLAEIDLELSQVSNKLNVIEGFKKLRRDILENLGKVKKDQEPTSTKIFAKDFVTGLKVAKNIELLMVEGKENVFMNTLAEITEFKSPSTPYTILKDKIKSAINSRCEVAEIKSKDYTICKSIPDFDEETIKSLQRIVEKGLDKKELTSWQKALSIKKAGTGEAYSFSKLYEDLDKKIDEAGKVVAQNQLSQMSDQLDLTPTQITAIKSLPDFSSNEIFDFQNVKLEAERLSLFQDYKDFLKSSAKRHELELKEKFILFRAQLDQKAQEKFSGDDNCKKPLTQTNFTSIKTCIDHFKPESKLTDDNNLQKNLKALQTSSAYITNLKGTITKCFDSNFRDSRAYVEGETEIKETPVCAQEFIKKNFQEEENELHKKLKSLEIVRKNILGQNKNDIIVRDFVQKKLKKECYPAAINTHQSEVQCNLPPASKVASFDSEFIEFSGSLGDSMGLIDIFSDEKSFFQDGKNPCKMKPKEEIKFESDEIKALVCSTKTKSSGRGSRDYDRDLQPPDDDRFSPARSAVINGLGNALGTLAGSLFAPTPNYNFSTMPSPYGFTSPYGYGYPIMSPSEQLLFEARYFGGYGNYWSTPGLRPYSSLAPSRMGRYWP